MKINKLIFILLICINITFSQDTKNGTVDLSKKIDNLQNDIEKINSDHINYKQEADFNMEKLQNDVDQIKSN